MVIDSINRWKSYAGLLPYYEEAMNFALSLADRPAGRYECESLPEGTVYAMIQEGETSPWEEGMPEAHRKYADVQIMLEGGETVGYADICGLKETVPYSEEKDIIFYENAGQPVHIQKGMFYLVLPQDAHMPCRHQSEAEHYRKIVLKIRL